MPTLMEIMQDEELGAAARAEADAIFGDVVNVYQTQQAPIVTDFVQDNLGNYQRRDVHGEGEYRFSPVQLERAMRAKTGQSSIRENIFDYLLKTTGNPSYATTGAVGADFAPVLGTAIGLEDAYYSGADIPEDLREGNYIGAANKGGQVALELGTALLGAIPAGKALGGLIDTVAPTARADIAGLGRGIMQADPSMVGEVFQRGGTPQSLSSANVEIIPSVLGLGRQDVKMYSPSLRAAEGLKQEKGTYEQLRKMMLNEGAKADELNWSGADAEFGGKKVTKQALVDYLSENTDMIEEGLLESSGKLGGEAKSADEMVNEYVENALDNEIEYYRTDHAPEMALDSGYYSTIDNLDAEEIEEAAAALGYKSSDEFIEKSYRDWVYVKNENGQWKQFADDEEIGLDYFGEDAIRDMAEENLRDNAQYEADRDPAGFFEQYLGGDADDYYDQQFNEGDTEYSNYFTEGAEDYNEKLYQFVDPTGKIDPSALARGSHFDDNYRQGLIAHARTGRFPSTTGDDVRLVGEIQSDVAQEARKAGSNFQTREEMIAGSELERKIFDVNTDYNRVRNDLVDQFSQMSDTERAKINATIAEANFRNLRESAEFKLFAPNEPTITQLENQSFTVLPKRKLPESIKDWGDAEITAFKDYVRGHSEYPEPTKIRDNPTSYRHNLDRVMQLINKGTINPNIPKLHEMASNFKTIETTRNEAIENLQPLQNISRREPDGVETVESANLTEGAPFVDSTNKWVDMALRRNLFDAIREGSDVMAVPNSDMVRAMTYGTEKGQGEFYDRIVPKRFQDVVRRIDKNAKLEPMKIDANGFLQPVAGLRLSDEFIANVAKKGIPTFLAAGAVPMTGFMDYLQGQKQEEQRQMNNLLGYGGFM